MQQRKASATPAPLFKVTASSRSATQSESGFEGENGALGEFALTRTLRSLETKVAAGKSRHRATAADDNRDRIIAILGHELRNHLAPARIAADLLKREDLNAATVRSISTIIDRQVSGMTRLIDDLLDVARLRIDNLELRRSSAVLSEIIERCLESVRPLLAARTQALVVDVQPEPIVIDVDAMWLSQALQNLMYNAAKYTDPGGRISICARSDGHEAVIVVSDTGIGIAQGQLDAIFELYLQAGQARTQRAAGGLGIGLYLVRHLIEAHGGSIRAMSPGPGCGSDFIIRLPRNRAVRPASRPAI